MICPHCKKQLADSLVIQESARIRGKKISPKKSKSSAKNGKLGGRPKKIKEANNAKS